MTGIDLSVEDQKKKFPALKLLKLGQERKDYDVVMFLDVLEHIHKDRLDNFLLRYSYASKVIINVPFVCILLF